MNTLEQRQEQLAAMLDPLDIPGDWTPRQRAEYEAERDALRTEIHQRQLMSNVVTRAEAVHRTIEREIAAVTTYHDFQLAAHKILCSELDALNAGRGTSRAERELVANLQLSIYSLERGLRSLDGAMAYSLRSTRLGELMVAAGYVSDAENDRVYGGLRWMGTIPEVEERLTQLERQRVRAEMDVTVARRDAEMVWGEGFSKAAR